jgi:hypothetical protein
MNITLRIQKALPTCSIEVRLDGQLQQSKATEGLWQYYELDMAQRQGEICIFQYHGNHPETLDAVGAPTGKGFHRSRDVAMTTLRLTVSPHREGIITVHSRTQKHVVGELISQSFFSYETQNMKVENAEQFIGWNAKQRRRYICEQAFFRLIPGLCLVLLLLMITVCLFENREELAGRATYGDYAILGAVQLIVLAYLLIRTACTLRKAFYMKEKS